MECRPPGSTGGDNTVTRAHDPLEPVDVCVVGAGVSGVTAAIVLTEHGRRSGRWRLATASAGGPGLCPPLAANPGCPKIGTSWGMRPGTGSATVYGCGFPVP